MRGSGQQLWRQLCNSFQPATGYGGSAACSSQLASNGAEGISSLLRIPAAAAACRSSMATARRHIGASHGIATLTAPQITAAAAAELLSAGGWRKAVRRLAARRPALQQSRGIFASSKAPSPQQVQTKAQHQSVWVSDPAALKSAAGVGLVSGSAGIPHFSYSRHFVRPIVFTLAVSGSAYAWALARDEDQRRYITSVAEQFGGGMHELEGFRALQHREEWQRQQWVGSLPQPFRFVAERWAALPEPHRTLSIIVGTNVAVFVAWRVPGLQSFMAKHFAHTPGMRRSHTLLTSAFSHRGLLHLGCNMLALMSFGGAAMRELGRDQLLAFYVSAAGVASLASHLATVWPILGRNIPAAALLQRVQAIRPSLGASGAVIALFGLVAMRQPDQQVALVFAPTFPFSISSGFKGMVAFDTAGVLFRWRIFDHAAHLGGAAFGAWYSFLGEDWIWRNPRLRQLVNLARQEWQHLGEEDPEDVRAKRRR